MTCHASLTAGQQETGNRRPATGNRPDQWCGSPGTSPIMCSGSLGCVCARRGLSASKGPAGRVHASCRPPAAGCRRLFCRPMVHRATKPPWKDCTAAPLEALRVSLVKPVACQRWGVSGRRWHPPRCREARSCRDRQKDSARKPQLLAYCGGRSLRPGCVAPPRIPTKECFVVAPCLASV